MSKVERKSEKIEFTLVRSMCKMLGKMEGGQFPMFFSVFCDKVYLCVLGNKK